MSCENKYSLLDRILFSLILNVNFKIKMFLFDNFKFQDNTNENDSNDINSFLFSDNKYDLNQNNVNKNNNSIEKLESNNDKKNNNVKNVNIVRN